MVLIVDQARRRLRARLRTRFTLIVLALLALHLVAAIETWNAHPPEQTAMVGLGPRPGPYLNKDADGSFRLNLGKLRTGERLLRVVRLPLPPTFLEIWSPVIGSMSITLLVLFVPMRRSARRYGNNPSIAGSDPPPGLSRTWIATRRAMVVGALIGLNLAGAVHRPPQHPVEQRLDPLLWSGAILFPRRDGSFLFPGPGGSLVIRAADGSVRRPATVDNYPLPLHGGYGADRVLDTVVYKRDGSIVAYDGNPGLLGRILGPTRVIQPPARSSLEMWWPAIASALITLIVLDLVWRQSRRPQTERITENGE